MPLATQVAGALLAGVIAFLLARNAGLGKRHAAAGIAVVPLAVASLLGVQNLRSATNALLDRHEATKGIDARQAQLLGGIPLGMDVEFLGWVEQRLEPGDTFHLLTDNETSAAGIEQWTLFQLAPNIAVEHPRQADWLVLYQQDEGSGYRPERFERPQVYAPRYLIVKRRDEG